MSVDYVKRAAVAPAGGAHTGAVVKSASCRELKYWAERYVSLARECQLASLERQDRMIKNPRSAPYAARNAAASELARWGSIVAAEAGCSP